MSSTFEPRICPPDAWKAWLFDGRQILRRSLYAWLPFQILITFVGVWLIMSTPPGTSGLLMGMGVFVLLGPLWGLQLAAVEALAEGTVGPAKVLASLAKDFRDNGFKYLRVMTVRFFCMVIVFFLMAAFYPSSASQTSVVLLNPWIDALQTWGFLWAISSSTRVSGSNGFYPQLAWKMGLPTPFALALDAQAYAKNRPALRRLALIFFMAPLIALLAPFLFPLFEVYWAGVIRSAYADIFDQPGLKAVQRQTQEKASSDTCAAMSR